jgi:hypothetical protein
MTTCAGFWSLAPAELVVVKGSAPTPGSCEVYSAFGAVYLLTRLMHMAFFFVRSAKERFMLFALLYPESLVPVVVLDYSAVSTLLGHTAEFAAVFS